MCIRDSHCADHGSDGLETGHVLAGTLGNTQNHRALHFLAGGQNGLGPLQIVDAVSYTHLDVYKRQPYFYSTYDGDNEAAEFIAEKEAEASAKGEPRKKKVLVFGSGPIRIGKGIEFDY